MVVVVVGLGFKLDCANGWPTLRAARFLAESSRTYTQLMQDFTATKPKPRFASDCLMLRTFDVTSGSKLRGRTSDNSGKIFLAFAIPILQS